MLSGKFQDALQERLNWLYKVEPMLAEETPVHGDVHTVSSFVEEHKVSPAYVDLMLEVTATHNGVKSTQ